jgi:hypothetical protein
MNKTPQSLLLEAIAQPKPAVPLQGVSLPLRPELPPALLPVMIRQQLHQQSSHPGRTQSPLND